MDPNVTIPPLRTPIPQDMPWPTPDSPAGAPAADGQGFDQILASMLGGANLQPESPAPLGAAEPLRPEALVFNEKGYFGATGSVRRLDDELSAQPQGGPTAPPPMPLARDVAAMEVPEAVASLQTSPVRSAGAFYGAMGAIDGNPLPAVGRFRSPVAAPKPMAPTAESAPSTMAELADAPEERLEETEARGPAPLPESDLPAGATINAQLSLAESGDVMNIAVRLHKLSREQRARLRSEIAQLLVRHGMSAGEIVVNGEIGPGAGTMKERS
jgi:hypothetical protein